MAAGTVRLSRYQKDETSLDFTEARHSKWQWHQLGRMQVCTSLQTDNHASTPPLCFFTGRMPFLPPNQQCQSTEGTPTRIWNSKNFPGVIPPDPRPGLGKCKGGNSRWPPTLSENWQLPSTSTIAIFIITQPVR